MKKRHHNGNGNPKRLYNPRSLTDKAHLDASIPRGMDEAPSLERPLESSDGPALSINVSAPSTSKTPPDGQTSGSPAALMTQKYRMKESRSTTHHLPLHRPNLTSPTNPSTRPPQTHLCTPITANPKGTGSVVCRLWPHRL
ncbi:hypothetical protein VC83_03705 [Pseudogymnoascus destructans]|uniref:Uncharacterized protein n=1 Tax=Pseudogymnoascus destructans TaxID=655981 RepID=A0A177ACW9_9PEZI|nr:uncharacterized protein VC83_03705 [Pseudogymnoascus destructans]OAF59650.1 hypothetical protein VC83_03705 [Pseudogymnoascus destructans]